MLTLILFITSLPTFITLSFLLSLLIARSRPHPSHEASTSSLSESDLTAIERSLLESNSVIRQGWIVVRRRNEPVTSSQGLRWNLFDRRSNQSREPPRPKCSYYAVLRTHTLYLYSDRDLSDPKATIDLSRHRVEMWPYNEKDGEMFTKANAIRLTPSPGKWEVDEEGGEVKWVEVQKDDPNEDSLDRALPHPFFIQLANNSEKEDWHTVLLNASRLESEEGIKSVAADAKMFDSNDLQSFIETSLDSGADLVQWRVVNAFIARLFYGIYKTVFVENYIREKMTKKISRTNLPGWIKEITLVEVDIGDKPPLFSKPLLKDFSPNGAINAELSMQYPGTFRIRIRLQAVIPLGLKGWTQQVDVELDVKIKHLKGTLQLMVKPPPTNRIWFCFTSPPDIDLDIQPLVGNKVVNYPFVVMGLKSVIMSSINDSIVTPNMEDVPFFDTSNFPHRAGIFSDALRIPAPPPIRPANANSSPSLTQDSDHDVVGLTAPVNEDAGSSSSSWIRRRGRQRNSVSNAAEVAASSSKDSSAGGQEGKSNGQASGHARQSSWLRLGLMGFGGGSGGNATSSAIQKSNSQPSSSTLKSDDEDREKRDRSRSRERREEDRSKNDTTPTPGDSSLLRTRSSQSLPVKIESDRERDAPRSAVDMALSSLHEDSSRPSSPRPGSPLLTAMSGLGTSASMPDVTNTVSSPAQQSLRSMLNNQAVASKKGKGRSSTGTSAASSVQDRDRRRGSDATNTTAVTTSTAQTSVAPSSPPRQASADSAKTAPPHVSGSGVQQQQPKEGPVTAVIAADAPQSLRRPSPSPPGEEEKSDKEGKREKPPSTEVVFERAPVVAVPEVVSSERSRSLPPDTDKAHVDYGNKLPPPPLHPNRLPPQSEAAPPPPPTKSVNRLSAIGVSRPASSSSRESVADDRDNASTSTSSTSGKGPTLATTAGVVGAFGSLRARVMETDQAKKALGSWKGWKEKRAAQTAEANGSSNANGGSSTSGKVYGGGNSPDLFSLGLEQPQPSKPWTPRKESTPTPSSAASRPKTAEEKERASYRDFRKQKLADERRRGDDEGAKGSGEDWSAGSSLAKPLPTLAAPPMAHFRQERDEDGARSPPLSNRFEPPNPQPSSSAPQRVPSSPLPPSSNTLTASPNPTAVSTTPVASAHRIISERSAYGPASSMSIPGVRKDRPIYGMGHTSAGSQASPSSSSTTSASTSAASPAAQGTTSPAIAVPVSPASPSVVGESKASELGVSPLALDRTEPEVAKGANAAGEEMSHEASLEENDSTAGVEEQEAVGAGAKDDTS